MQKTHDSEMHAFGEPSFSHDFSQIQVSSGAKQLSPPIHGEDQDGNRIHQIADLSHLPFTTPRSCPFGGVCHTCPARLQTKLAINQPGDEYEQEADRVAEQVVCATKPYFTPIRVWADHHGASGQLQRWNQETHERITTLAGNRVLNDPLFVWQVSQRSASMDVTAKRLLWTGPRFLLGIDKGEGPEHGEDGNYSNPSESAARAQNIREQNKRLRLAVQRHREFERLQHRGEPVHRLGGVAERVFQALGDACHIAQDRGSHGEGVRGRGHNDPRTQQGWNPDDPSDNSVGYAQAVANTVGLFEEWQRLTADVTTSGILQRQAASEVAPATALAQVHEVLHSPGEPLDAATEKSMESRFGHDFSRVRTHTDRHAAESARAVNALAYTVGQHIVFGSGQYAPSTKVGQKLLAHELTHVLQQETQKTLSPPLTLTSEDRLLKNQTQQFSDSLVECAPSLNRKENRVATRRHTSPSFVLQRLVPSKGFLPPLGFPPRPFTTVDDTKVQKYIDEAMRSTNNNVGLALNHVIILRNEPSKPENCYDSSLAAADHYLFNRWRVAKGDSYLGAVITTVVVKPLLSSLEIPTGRCPPSPPSYGQVKWGLKGARDGRDDFRRARAQRGSP